MSQKDLSAVNWLIISHLINVANEPTSKQL
jgi:hypothetical protein